MRLCSPADFGNASLSLPPPPLGDGRLQLSTNNHSSSIWLHSFCLGWGKTKRSYGDGHVLCVLLCLSCGLLFTREKNIHSTNSRAANQTVADRRSEKPGCVFVCVAMFYLMVVTVTRRRVIFMVFPEDLFDSMLCCQSE